jgi:hypothetical protein
VNSPKNTQIRKNLLSLLINEHYDNIKKREKTERKKKNRNKEKKSRKIRGLLLYVAKMAVITE